MENKKPLYIILAVVAVVLVAVIVIAAIKLSEGTDAAGGQPDVGGTTTSENVDTTGNTEDGDVAQATSEATETSEKGSSNGGGGNKKPANDNNDDNIKEKPGIDFDELLS